MHNDAQTPVSEPLTAVATRLRWGGGLVLAIATAVFLLQGLGSYLPAYRDWAVLAVSAALGLLGAFCGFKLGERKTGRVLFGFATAMLAVHMAQVGAMVFASVGQADAERLTGSYVAALGGAGFLLLLPMAYFGFSFLARPHARLMTAFYVVASASLVAPTRAPEPVALLLLGLGIAALAIERAQLSAQGAPVAREAWAARGIMWLPIVILAVREAFYPFSPIFPAALGALVAVACLVTLPRLIEDVKARATLHAAGTGAAAISWLLFAATLPWDSQVARLALFYPVVLLVGMLSLLAPADGHRYRAIASVVALMLAVAGFFCLSGGEAATVCLLAGPAYLAGGIVMRERAPLAAGCSVLGLGLAWAVTNAFHHLTVSPVAGLALAGMALLLGAAMLERRGHALLVKVRGVAGAVRSYR